MRNDEEPTTENTQPQSPRSSASRGSSSTLNSLMIESILSSTQQIINQQAKKIFQLTSQLNQIKKSYSKLQAKYTHLLLTVEKEEKQKTQTEKLLDKIIELQAEIMSLKIDLALEKENNLQKKYQMIKDSRQMKNIPQPQKNNINQFFSVGKFKDNINFIKKKINFNSEAEISGSREIWQKHITNYGNASLHKGTKFKQKSAEIIRKFIPHSMREAIWPIIFENYLGITNSLYVELLSKKQKNYAMSKVQLQIEKDISRSFYGKTQFGSKTGLAEEVCQVLQIFHLYRPDVSYVQGMTYPVIVLDLVVGKIKAFTIFSNIVLTNKFFRRLFTFESNYVSVYCRAFDILLSEFFPLISTSLSDKKIQSQIYLVEWFFTFYSRGMTFQSILKVWDLLAYQQELLFYRLGLTIIELLGSKIMKSDYETTIRLIREYSANIREEDIFPLILNHKLTLEKLEKTIEKHQKMVKK